jgi:hypothetical protein
MSVPFPRIIFVVHSLPGRLRLRLPWLHDHREQGEPLADELVKLSGMLEVRVRPFSGSVLCSFEAMDLDERRIVSAVQESSGVRAVIRRGEAISVEAQAALRLQPGERNHIARAAARFFQDVSADVLEATEGRLDLATLASLAFASAGAAEVAMDQKLPLPPWFQLAWWAFRTFTTMEGAAIERSQSESLK